MEKTDKELGLYIHIPFCIKKCLYCDFLSFPASEREQELYVKALKREIMEESAKYQGFLARSVYLGGGTPSLLFGRWVEEIMETVYSCYQVEDGCEISLEANPGTITAEKLKAWKRAGINRLSIGMQSAEDKELLALGRIHKSEDFFKAYQMVSDAGFTNINVDLMAGIPGQSLVSYKNSLKRVAGLVPAPAHISAYSLIIEEGTPFYEHTPKLIPDEDTEREMYQATGEILASYGYRQYEISNYAKPGYECRHNVAYWRRKNYVGFGIGAASLVENVRFRNKPDWKAYVEGLGEGRGQEESFREEIQKLSKKEQMEEFMFLGLRMTKGVSCREFFQAFGSSIDGIYPGVVEDFCKKGLLKREKQTKDNDIRISLTRRGIDVSNYVMAEFLLS